MNTEAFLRTVKSMSSSIPGMVLVLRGVPGSGKSTLANKLLLQQSGRVRVYSADLFPGLYVNGNLDASKLGDAHAECLSTFAADIVQGRQDTYIVDNTNIALFDCSKYIELAIAFRQRAFIVNVRHENGPAAAMARNIHNVPTTVCERMAREFETTRLLPWWPVMDVTTEAARNGTGERYS